jgi:hypothetical protein
LQSEFPPLNSVPIATNNLPTQLTSFIGRERELAEAREKLASARLLTLIGPGGTGKTRLSLQIGEGQILHFRDGVWLVELAPIRDPNFIVQAIASVFEVREVQNIPLIQLIIDYLRGRELLLLLDNCEHLVEACARVADQLLHACPNLKIIASSRGAFFANGLDVADDGSIYVANEHPGTTGGIYRIHPGGSTLELYHRCFGCTPNGVRVRGTQLYYSGLQTWPYPAAVLREVDLSAGSPKPDSSRILVVRPASVFDDFDVVDSDFVIAEFASFRHLPLGAGGLLFFSRSGEFRREIRTSELTHPSSVRVCPAGVPGLEAGDLLVTEKIGHQLLALRLKGTWAED